MLNEKQIGYVLTIASVILILLLIILKIDLNRKAAKTCAIIANNPDVSMEECPYHQNNITSWLLPIAFGIGIFLFTSGLYLIVRPKEEDGEDFKDVDTSKLGEAEQQVYDELRDSEGAMYQSDLIKETDLSKVKMTRTLDKLENKDIAERKRRGMTNLVVLK